MHRICGIWEYQISIPYYFYGYNFVPDLSTNGSDSPPSPIKEIEHILRMIEYLIWSRANSSELKSDIYTNQAFSYYRHTGTQQK